MTQSTKQGALNTLRNALDYTMTAQNHDASLAFAESVISTKAILWNSFWAVYDSPVFESRGVNE